MTALTPEEQLFLELTNRARLDPAAEAVRQNVGLNQFIEPGSPQAPITTDPKQPLAGNNTLTRVAENHSSVVFNRAVSQGNMNFDAHNGAGDGEVMVRIRDAGYVQNQVSWIRPENFTMRQVWGDDFGTTAKKQAAIEAMHAGLFIDDPKNSFGEPGGHRLAMMDPNMKEMGAGLTWGTFQDKNTVMGFENFGSSGSQSFLTGAVYNDTVIKDDFYSLGEAVSNVTVTAFNSAGNAIGSDKTGSGGGWTVGEPGGTYKVTFSGGGLATSVSATVEAGNLNAKVDLVNGNRIDSSVNTTLGDGAKDLRLLGMANINGTGNSAANVITGNKGANILDGKGGNDTIDGGDGIDTVVFSGKQSDYQVTVSGNTAKLVDNRGIDGTDTIVNIEKVQFSDGLIDFSKLQNTPAPTPGSISVGDVTITEGNNGQTFANFVVTRTGGSSAFTVQYATADGTATAGSDYVAKNGTLQFAAGVNSQTVSIAINGDTAVEANETFKLKLSGASSGATIARSEATGTITNDDTALASGSVSVSDVTISEGNSGQKMATFTVTRTGGSAAFNVQYATADGTATAGSDYVAKSGTLQFAAGVNTQTVSIAINGDTVVEANETFKLNLSGATNGATISDSQGIGTITNDDTAPVAGSVSISDVTITEGASGQKMATFTVTRTGGSSAFNLQYATADGTATAGSDYVAKSGTLQFASGVNTQTISIAIKGDTVVEANETFKVNLSGATNGATITDSQGIGTITNDDTAPANSAPVVTGKNVTLIAKTSVPVSSLFTATDPQGNSTIKQYAFWDGGNGGGHFVVNGVVQPSGQWIYVKAADLGKVSYVGGVGDGSEQLWVSAFDGQTWAANAPLTAKTVANPTHDFNGDGASDVLWTSASGQVAMWQMDGNKILSNVSVGSVAKGWHADGVGDFTGDGKADVLWTNASGQVAMWKMDGSKIVSNVSVGKMAAGWKVADVDDFNGDGKSDILLSNASTGKLALWQMDGNKITASTTFGTMAKGWHVENAADFTGDGKADILLRNDNGSVALWQMDGNKVVSMKAVGSIGTDWHFAGADDVNGDGKADILWHNDNGKVALWEMDGANIVGNNVIGSAATNWNIAEVGDYNHDGHADILWQSDTGQVAMWQMDGTHVTANVGVGSAASGWLIS